MPKAKGSGLKSKHGKRVGPVIALLGDIVKSRRFEGARRRKLQERLERLMAELNEQFGQALLAKFVITEGDSFQALLHDATAIPRMVLQIERQLHPVKVRF